MGVEGTRCLPLAIKRVDSTGSAQIASQAAPAPPSAATLPAALRPRRGAGGRPLGVAGQAGRGRRCGRARVRGAVRRLLSRSPRPPGGPSVPPAPWAIVTRWGPTRRWWFQVRRPQGGGSETPGAGRVFGAGAVPGRAGEGPGRGRALRAGGRWAVPGVGPESTVAPETPPRKDSHSPCSAP